MTTTIYTVFGGVQAVTWTDVKQMIVIFVGLGVCFFIILSKLPEGVGLTDAMHLAGATGRLKTIDTSFDLREKYTLWSGLIGGLFLMLSYFGCDQSQVQRFLTARSVDEGRTSLLMSAFVKIPMQFFILLIGVLVFIFYQFERAPVLFREDAVKRIESGARAGDFAAVQAEHDAAAEARSRAATEYVRAERANDGSRDAARDAYLAADSQVKDVRGRAVALAKESGDASFTDVNYVFPSFVVRHMPMGVVGLIIAAIFAAAMSSISAELNALATATVIDFYKRHLKPEAAESHYVAAGRAATLLWGLFACVVALYATTLGSLIEVVNRFGSFFYGSLLGVFVLAVGVRRATGRGAFWGLLFGIASVALASRFTDIEFLWFNPIGCIVVVVVGYLISLTDARRAPQPG